MKKLMIMAVAGMIASSAIAQTPTGKQPQTVPAAVKPAPSQMNNQEGKADMKKDREDIQKDKADIEKDKKDMMKDKKAGDKVGMMKDKAEIKKDRADLNKEKADLHKDLNHHPVNHRQHSPATRKTK